MKLLSSGTGIPNWATNFLVMASFPTNLQKVTAKKIERAPDRWNWS